MPRIREEISDPKDLEVFMISEYQHNLATVYQAGILFLEMLSDVSAKRGNYHTVGANRLGVKFLVTSNINDSKFYAGGARLADLLQELSDVYNWSEDSLQEALRRAIAAEKALKVVK